MHENSIVEEVHRIREEMLAEYCGDMSAYLAETRRRTEELAKAGRVVVIREPPLIGTPSELREDAP